MRILLALAVVVAIVVVPAHAAALTPPECDALGAWVYAQAGVRDSGEVSRAEHERLVRAMNGELNRDVVAMLVRELRKVYDDRQDALAAGMDARLRCYQAKGEVGVIVNRDDSG